MDDVIVLKIGSHVIMNRDGMLDEERLQSVVNAVVEARECGKKVVLISSGAVSSGLEIYEAGYYVSQTQKRQVLSAIGQGRLFEKYRKRLGQHRTVAAQVLVTSTDFRDVTHRENMRVAFEGMLANDIVPIVNENDTVAIDELMFTDNDELAGHVVRLLGARTLILGTNVDGVYNGDPHKDSTEVIDTLWDDQDVSQYLSEHKSSLGRGGMHTKVATAQRVAHDGVDAYILDATRAGFMKDILANRKIGTHICKRIS